MNLPLFSVVMDDPTPTPTPDPEPSPTPTETSSPTPDPGSGSGDSPTSDEPPVTGSDPWTPPDTACGTMTSTQDVCVHLTPDTGTFFGTSFLLAVLLLSALLASQLRRP